MAQFDGLVAGYKAVAKPDKVFIFCIVWREVCLFSLVFLFQLSSIPFFYQFHFLSWPSYTCGF
jgi:hypothetical protein